MARFSKQRDACRMWQPQSVCPASPCDLAPDVGCLRRLTVHVVGGSSSSGAVEAAAALARLLWGDEQAEKARARCAAETAAAAAEAAGGSVVQRGAAKGRRREVVPPSRPCALNATLNVSVVSVASSAGPSAPDKKPAGDHPPPSPEGFQAVRRALQSDGNLAVVSGFGHAFVRGLPEGALLAGPGPGDAALERTYASVEELWGRLADAIEHDLRKPVWVFTAAPFCSEEAEGKEPAEAARVRRRKNDVLWRVNQITAAQIALRAPSFGRVLDGWDGWRGGSAASQADTAGWEADLCGGSAGTAGNATRAKEWAAERAMQRVLGWVPLAAAGVCGNSQDV